MSSLKMTFSLTSLILIFAFAFVAMPVIAAPDGATVEIAAYTGKVDGTGAPAEDDATGAVDYVATRANFIATITLSKPAALLTSHVTVRKSAGENEVAAEITGSTVAQFPGSTNQRKWTVQIDIADTAYAMSRLVVSIAEDAFNDLTADPKGNQASTGGTFTSLPKDNDWTFTATLGDDAPEIADDKFTVPASGDPNTFTVLLTQSGSTAAPENLTDMTFIQVKDADGDDVTLGTQTVTTTGLVTTIEFSIATGAAVVEAPVFVGVNPQWANAMPDGGLRIPAAAPPEDDPVYQNPPTVMLEVVSHNEAEMSFQISVTTDPVADTDGEDGADIAGADIKAALMIMDGSDPAIDITAALISGIDPSDERVADNSYRAIIGYGTFDTLPLTVSLDPNDLSDNEDAADVDPVTDMVGEAGPTPPPADAPAKPDAPTAEINADNDLIIDVSWMEPDDNGSAITGYTVTKYDSDGDVVKTFPETGDDPITDTMLAVGPVPEADRGMSFTFTVTAMNANGSGPESDMSGAVMIPEAPTVPNNPPEFPAGSAIADIIIWKGHAYTTPVLPKATDDEGDEIKPYTIMPELPDGLLLKANDVQDRTIQGTATAASAKTAYKFIATDAAGATDEIEFNITVLEPIKPSAPTSVTAMEEGDLGYPGNIARTINSNKVVVGWVAPVDTTVTSHDPAIPFGSPITGYMVYQNHEDISEVIYPRAAYNDDPIKADATGYTTPVLNPPGPVGTYEFEVAAVNAVGTGAKSDPAADALVANPPSQSRDLRASKVPSDPNSVTLNWLLPTSDGGAPILAYIIYQTLDGRPKPDVEIAPAVTHRLTDLDAGRHVFRVAAVNYDGLGSRSESTEFSVDIPPDPTDPVNVKPSFGNESIANITATVGTAIDSVTLPAATDPDGDDGDITYSLLPNVAGVGLSFNAATRFLSGTPTRAQSARAYTYTARDADGGTASLNFTLTVNTAPLPPRPTPTGDLNATHLNGVTTINSGSIAANGFATLGAQSLPDLEEFFEIGGTIGLSNGDATDDKNSRTIIISEILWGLDFGAPATDQTKWQFIELYNTTGAAIPVAGWTLTFKGGNVLDAIDIDQVSNRGRTGWDVDSGDTGKSGRVTGTLATDVESAITPVNIVSMYRNINYDHIEAKVADRAELVKGIPGGNAKGSWKSSQRRSAYNRWIYDSKRAEHFKSEPILSPSAVAGTPFRINEVGNGDGSANDWVEIHNVTDAEASLKNYALSKVTAQGTDTKIFDFKDQDWKVPAKGYVVISTRHPRDTDLAAGKDISVADDQEENRGASHLYVVKTVDLPDDGKFALILRNAHDKQGGDGHLVDVVATTAGAFGDNNIATSLWPLKATGAPHGNVIDGGDEVFKAGLVYQRNGGNGRGEKQFAVRGFTGVGYDRAAEDTAANGGTPGYDNGAVKEKVADLSNAEVTFSEIMLGLGDGRQNLPQWIEIYNSSMTQAVNTNGWKLHVENYTDVKTALDAVITLGNMEIAPNQTILIVTNTGRISDPDHFPSNRIVNLWTTKAHRDALEMVRRTDQVFSAMGFNLQLYDKDNKLVDEAGNLDGNRRTRDELDKTWAIPMNGDDARRSSLIRVYDAGVAIDGTMKEAWVLADETNLAYAISETYYGDPDDYGTPGFRGGGPLPVSLSKFRPERLKDTGEIVVRWITESELNNAGFNILRSEKRDGEFTKVHFVAGQGTTTERTSYEWKDTSAKPNVVYYYQIQDVSLDGKVTTLRQSRLKGNVTPAGNKITTTWGDIKALQ